MLGSMRLLAPLTLLLALPLTLARSRAPVLNTPITRDDSICGQANNPGIIKPANGSTVTISVADQWNYETSLEVIYCSDAYFKTSPINITSWLSYAWNPTSGELLAAGVGPDWDIASPGFGGYRFNVTLNPPDDGSWDEDDGRVLFVEELQTGYYYEYGVELWSVSFNFALATATTTITSSTSVGTLSIDCNLYPFLCPSSTSSSHLVKTTASSSIGTSSSENTTKVTSSVGTPLMGTDPTTSVASKTKSRHSRASTSNAAPSTTPPPYPYPSYVNMSPGLFLA